MSTPAPSESLGLVCSGDSKEKPCQSQCKITRAELTEILELEKKNPELFQRLYNDYFNSNGRCDNCDHKISRHPSAPPPASFSPYSVTVSPPLLLRQMDDFGDPRHSNKTNRVSISVPPSGPDILSRLESVTVASFAGWAASHPPRSSLKFYFFPHRGDWEIRTKLSSQADYELFLELLRIGRCDTLWVYVEPAESSKDNQSPPKRPPAIDVALANLERGVMEKSKSPSGGSASLTPDSADLSPSEKQKREELFKQEVKTRDFDKEKMMNYCVFCRELCSDVVCCHLWPVGVKERMGMSKPIAVSHLNSLTNGVTACTKCHNAFDWGKFWVESDSEGRLVVRARDDPLLAADEHLEKINGRSLRLPQREDADEEEMLRLMFPNKFAWKWRQEWAQKAFESWKSSKLKQLAKEAKKEGKAARSPSSTLGEALETKLASLFIAASSAPEAAPLSAAPVSTASSTKCADPGCDKTKLAKCLNGLCRTHCIAIISNQGNRAGEYGCGKGSHKV